MNQAQHDHADFVARECDGIEREHDAPAGPRLLDREDIEAVIACLGDDAAQLHGENPEDERADNMVRAADMLRKLADDNYRVAQLLLDQDREGAKDWARGLHINMDGSGGITAAAAGVQPARQTEQEGGA